MLHLEDEIVTPDRMPQTPIAEAEAEAQRRRSKRLLRLFRAALSRLVDPPRARTDKRTLRYRGYSRLLALLPAPIKRSLRVPEPHLAVYRAELRQSRHRPEILLVSHELTPTGAPKVLEDIAIALLSFGYAVTVASPKDGVFRDRLLAAGANVVIDQEMLRGTGLILRMAQEAALVICNTVVTYKVVRNVSSFRPCFWYVHEVERMVEWLRTDQTFREACAAPLGVWAGSEISARILRPHRPDVLVLPYGSESLAVPTGPDPAETNRKLKIGLFGSLEPRKGQDIAAEAVKQLAPALRSQIELTFYGRRFLEPYEERVFSLISDMPDIEYAGDLPFEEYRSALLATDAVLVPSTSDTLPLVSIDALSSGRILICTRQTGTSAYLDDGRNGFVAEEASPAAVAAALARALGRRHDWREIGLAGRQTFLENFSREHFESRLRALVEQAIGTGS